MQRQLFMCKIKGEGLRQRRQGTAARTVPAIANSLHAAVQSSWWQGTAARAGPCLGQEQVLLPLLHVLPLRWHLHASCEQAASRASRPRV